MRRRDFVKAVTASIAWPLTARAQQNAMPVIGFLSARTSSDSAHLVAVFRQALADNGFIEGRNVAIEFRWADGQYDRLPALASELANKPVAVLFAGANAAALAAKSATATIPIVFAIGGDPVDLGLVSSLNRPGGNLTGVSVISSALEAKRLELLHELLPDVTDIAVLINPTDPQSSTESRDTSAAAQTLGLHLHTLSVSDEHELARAFGALVQLQIGALLIPNDAFFNSRRDQLVTLAAHHSIPAIYPWREYAEVGGLMAYGTSLTDAYRQVGNYAGRILKGAKPADLPVLQSIKFEFVINLKTAKVFGLSFPPGLLAIADEVIE
jgi:putative ABC transport system substrate-binding protein